ncbi:NAD-dependent epimerase/dehydratase family protein [Vibrio sp. S11_S32]|uniref:NAD-dependent epimerase/dehydratase family protein n=1 Tax=Vibrio sp. S11_S32 TaxID=2720225 RepID=UPI00167FFC0A|nr:NAD-dependent epimerase/dehydratase family protein [Vibrio sp. S11_S32]MBD1577534.1 NAD-dependent epimerase/dehydratase family protein [Vibrio sp. S11_S32]
MDKNISICGCGWLGLALAKSLVSDGYCVYGSKQNLDEVVGLKEYGIHGVQLQLPLIDHSNNNLSNQIGHDNNDKYTKLNAFFSSDVLFINLPPRRKPNSAQQFKHNVMQVSEQAKLHGIKKVIFISTTSVYADCHGEITEDTPTKPNTDSGQAHVWLENELRQQWQDNLVVLRLSGLIGPDRHPAKHIVKRYLSSQEALDNGLTPVNLIHQHDIICAIQSILQHWPERKVLHLSAHSHPTRADYYQAMAQHLGLTQPEFVSNGENNKWINTEQSYQALRLTLKYGDLMAFKPYE